MPDHHQPHHITLTPHQAAALDHLVPPGRRPPPNGPRVLSGAAGCGKTVVLAALAGRLRECGLRVAAVAPTHAATRNLAEKLAAAGFSDIHTCTIHSLLGLRPQNDSDREQRLVSTRGGSRAGAFGAILLDETSMVGCELQNHLTRMHRTHTVIYCGDLCQLTPVGEPPAACFDFDHHARLTEPARQAATSPLVPVIALCRAQQDRRPPVLSNAWARSATPAPVPADIYGAEGLFELPPDRQDPKLTSAEHWLREAFLTNGADCLRILCYRNEQVHMWNAKIHSWLHPTAPFPWAVGEPVIARSTVPSQAHLNEGAALVLSNNQDATVLGVCRGATFQLRLYPNTKCPGGYLISADLEVYEIGLETDDATTATVKVLRHDHPATMAAFADALHNLRLLAALDRSQWPVFFAVKELFPDIRLAYARTTHTAQGGTYDSVFLDLKDFQRANRPSESTAADGNASYARMIYTALTRARFGVFVTDRWDALNAAPAP